MSLVTGSLLILLVTHNIQAEISLKDYVYWTKADVSAWHQYFPSRLLEQERLTIQQAIDTVATVTNNMENSLAATVRYQAQELATAQFSMEGTSAQGCVSGISNYMDKAIDEAVDSFRDCVADTPSYLQRLYNSWAKTNNSYNTAYQRALTGIDTCARTYPNRDSWSRLKSCVDAWTKIYFTSANATTLDMYWSRSMGAFAGTVATCAQTAASSVVAKGWRFLGMLVQCAKLSENIDSEMYEKEFTSEFYKYVTYNDLYNQIYNAQDVRYRFVKDVEQQMIYYYDLQKRALYKYVIESRNQSYYYGQMAGYIQKYLTTVSSTSVDNPANADCVSEANYALNNVMNTGATKALECDAKIVTNTKLLISQVNDYFSKINQILPYTGNVAVLSCFNEGYIFAEKTIVNCYSIAANGFKINITELNATIVDYVKVLLGYEESFFSNSSMPCSDSILARAFLEADRALYNLQRCLYINTGTKYAVTTYAPVTYTTTTASTTSTAATTTSTAPPTTTEAYITFTPTMPPDTTPATSTTTNYRFYSTPAPRTGSIHFKK